MNKYRGNMPEPEAVTEADQYAYLGANEARLPELECCRCDAAPYLHLTAIVPGTENVPETIPVRVCIVVEGDARRLTVLRIVGGQSTDQAGTHHP